MIELALTIAAAWLIASLVGTLLVLPLCRAAAEGDRRLEREHVEPWEPDEHGATELPPYVREHR